MTGLERLRELSGELHSALLSEIADQIEREHAQTVEDHEKQQEIIRDLQRERDEALKDAAASRFVAKELRALAGAWDEWGLGGTLIELAKRLERPAPAALAADGEPLEVGQTVWDTNGEELVIGALEDGGHTITCRYADVGDGIPVHGMWSPSDLTHQRPVLDADGVPIRVGDEMYGTVEGGPFIVTEVSDKGSVFIDAFPDTGMHGSMLTHTKPEPPDSWEQLEKDAKLKPFGYVSNVLGWDMRKSHSTNQALHAMTLDVVRRAKALAERERGE